jgi:glycosyltransferase involved in cell wall biosynthesis
VSLRIVRAIPFHEPARRFGGVVTQAALTSRELASRGHDVTVLSSDLDVDPSIPRDVPVDRGGFDVIYGRTRSPWQRRPPYAPALPTVVFEHALSGADVLMLNVGFTLWNVRAAAVARRAGVPYVYNAEGCLCPTRRRIKRIRKALFVTSFERRVLTRATRLVASTRDEARDYARLGADAQRIVVVPNGVRLPPPPDPADRAAGRTRLGVDPDTPLILFLGRLDPLKGIDLLFDAAAMVGRELPALHLAIVGPDDGDGERLALQARALPHSVRVTFLDTVHGVDRDRMLAAADVFALTSRSEGLPNAALEAAAAGLPCLLTEACHIPEVADYDAGAVVPESPDAIATALAALARDPALRASRGANARRMAAERFALESVVTNLETVLRSAADCRADRNR